MVALGFYFIALFAVLRSGSRPRGSSSSHRWLLRLALWSLPLPWIAAELGWFVAEIRPPALDDRRRAADLPVGFERLRRQCLARLAGFVLFYSVLAVVEVYLMVKYIRHGPEADSGRRPGARSRRAPSGAAHVLDYEILRLIWWAAAGRAADRLRRHGRLRSGRRHPAALRRPHRCASGASSSTPSGRSGKATRSGSSSAAARSSPPGRRSMPWRSPASISRCCWCCAALILRPVGFKFRSKLEDPRWRDVWDWRCSSAGWCRRWCSAWRSATCCRACRSASTTRCA